MDKELELSLKQKLAHLTIEGAREFWNEITEYLDSMVERCDGILRKIDSTDMEIRKAQLLRDTCIRLKGLPERMAESIRKQIAEDSAGDKKAELDVLNFFKSPQVA